LIAEKGFQITALKKGQTMTKEDKKKLTWIANQQIVLVYNAEELRKNKKHYTNSRYQELQEQIINLLEEEGEKAHNLLKKYNPKQTGMETALCIANEKERIQRENYFRRKALAEPTLNKVESR